MTSIRPETTASSGFSLIELLTSTVILAILMTALYGAYRSQVFAMRTQEVSVNVKEGADVGLDFIVKELRFAGARPVPEGYPPAGCTVPVSSASFVPACGGFEAITAADSQQVRFQYDFQGNNNAPDGCPDDVDEVITYSYNPSTSSVERTSNGTAQPLVSNVPANGLRFDYFDVNGTALVPSPGGFSATTRANIKRIVVTLTVSSPNPDPRVRGTISSTKQSSVFLRSPPC